MSAGYAAAFTHNDEWRAAYGGCFTEKEERGGIRLGAGIEYRLPTGEASCRGRQKKKTGLSRERGHGRYTHGHVVGLHGGIQPAITVTLYGGHCLQ